jgi:parallel beta-helix repeat protein
MTDYYLDPAATGAADGTSWADAFTSLYAATAAIVAGNTLYCRGEETVNSGAVLYLSATGNTQQLIRIIGCNASGVVDGTRYKLTFGTATQAMTIAGGGWGYYANLEISGNFTSAGISVNTNSRHNVFYNILIDGPNSTCLSSGDQSRFYYCICRNSNGNAFQSDYDCVYVGCAAYDCDGGFSASGTTTFINCIAHNNGIGVDYNDFGFRLAQDCVLVNCVSDGHYAGIYIPSYSNNIIGCRITNNTYGIYDIAAGDGTHFLNNYFHGNTNDYLALSQANVKMPLIDQSGSEVDSNLSNVDADDGYNDRSSDDFNLKSDRTYNGDGSDVWGLGLGS